MKVKIEENQSITKYQNTLFETILVEDGIPIFFEEHINRLIKAVFDLKRIILKFDELFNIIKPHIRDGEYGLRIIYDENRLILSYRDLVDSGFRKLCISPNRRDSRELKYQYKTSDYGQRLDDLMISRRKGCIDNIYLNYYDEVTSCSVANIFFIKDKVLYTPERELGVLNGIVRENLINNHKVQEGRFNITDLYMSDGVFITNSLIGIKDIDFIEDKQIHTNNEFIDEIKASYKLAKEKSRRNYLG